MFALRIVAPALLAGALAGCAGPPTTPLTESSTSDIRLGWTKVTNGPTMDLPTGEVVQGRVPTSSDGPVLVNFWGSWCGPCKKEMPLLERLADETGVQVIGVSRDRFEKYAKEFLGMTGATFPNVLDSDGSYMAQYSDTVPLQALPSSVLLVNGTVVAAHIGPFEQWSDLTTDRPE
ncbi:TlpA family protein disulfide reductase [Nocardioides dongkuii]|uniref:TlpA family protein disulfide reductase n=1 Tax=Nocardioides dongkuii TaxID=2760089 RepID=UPI0015FE2823|nr:TlpA disulfide reductase family protein [Nocardioides dongkuii]